MQFHRGNGELECDFEINAEEALQFTAPPLCLEGEGWKAGMCGINRLL